MAGCRPNSWAAAGIDTMALTIEKGTDCMYEYMHYWWIWLILNVHCNSGLASCRWFGEVGSTVRDELFVVLVAVLSTVVLVVLAVELLVVLPDEVWLVLSLAVLLVVLAGTSLVELVEVLLVSLAGVSVAVVLSAAVLFVVLFGGGSTGLGINTI